MSARRTCCEDCGTVLTDDERHYYEYRCEACEVRWHERITAWRNGAPDRELDAVYRGAPPATRH